jgi:predicted phosphoribosyltransferase
MPRQSFKNRREAGRKLADKLEHYADQDNAIVLGLPRGGVPVAYEVALTLNQPLDIYTVRKLGVPGHEEMAMGAIASGGTRVLNNEIVDKLNISDDDIQRVESSEREELARRENLYRGDRPPLHLEGRTVLLVDDGLATGATMRAAVQAVATRNPAAIVVAVPTAARRSAHEIQQMQAVDEMIAAILPENFRAVGLWYDEFGQTTDDEVRHLLQEAYERDEIPSVEPG